MTSHAYFEPVRYLTKGLPARERARGIREGYIYSRRARIRERTYFFDRTVRKNVKDFEPIRVGKEIDRIVEENIKSLLERLRTKFEKIVPSGEFIDKFVPHTDEFIDSITIDYEAPSNYYFHRHSSSVILPVDMDSFCIVSRTKEEATQLLQFIKSEFEKLNEVTKDFGLELVDFLTGRKFQESLLRSSENIENVAYKKPRNEFEKEIIDFCSKLTSSFLPNLEISFSEPTETFEYDIFLGLTENIKRIIEPTNYESIKDQMPKGENLKSQVILRTLDKAQRLEAKSVVITRGFAEETFKELKKIADSRGIVLLSDTNYKDMLFKIFCNDLLEAYRG